MLLRTFKRGGIHPPEEKLSADLAIEYGEIPGSLLVPVNQHIGKPCNVLVKKGTAVKRGDVLAEADGFVSSNVHAPVDGKVQKILNFPQLGGQIKECIQITPDNPGESYQSVLEGDTFQEVDVDGLDRDEIRKTIAKAGLVGMGGAGFPTHVKLSPPPDKTIDTLIINGAECEPYITADHRLMIEKSDELVRGIKILQKLFDDVMIYIGIEENKADAIETLEQATKDEVKMKVIPLKTKYPQGGEKQLIKAVLNREVPSKGLPMDVGVIVQNVGTLKAIYDAFFYQRPLMERVVTVSGNVVKRAGNILVPIGTPVSYLIEKYEIDKSRIKRLVSGGPMMGRTSYSFESPVSKTSSAVLFFDDSVYDTRDENPCIRCGNCIAVCPMGLPVAQVTEMIKANNVTPDIKNYIMDCIECGSCSYVCPADRRLVHWMRFGKNIINREN
ncbi:MAG: electron transport complex subunit RsxC [Caldithrix sp.]|nr:electron transport complex subunit RsxC [Caldithrix sp.]